MKRCQLILRGALSECCYQKTAYPAESKCPQYNCTWWKEASYIDNIKKFIKRQHHEDYYGVHKSGDYFFSDDVFCGVVLDDSRKYRSEYLESEGE